MISSAGLLIVTSMIVGQTEGRPGLAELEAYAKDFAGEWVSESVADRDEPGAYKAGDKIVAHLSLKWSDGKEALLLKVTGEVNGDTFNHTSGVLGWDAAAKSLVNRWYSNRGASGKIVITREGDVWNWKWDSTDGDGLAISWTATISFANADTYTVHIKNRQVRGENLPDRTTTWKRN